MNLFLTLLQSDLSGLKYPNMKYPKGPHQVHIFPCTSPCPATLARYQTERREVLRQDQGQWGVPSVGNQQLR